MYVKSMTIKNLRNVEFLDVEFSKLLNKISWKNWAWKSTLIDAIWFWILWKTYMWSWTSADLYITQWKEECEINIKVADENRTIHVRRKVTKAWNVYLEAFDTESWKIWQTELNALLYTICIDPLEFTRKNRKEQFELVKQITWCDTTDIDEHIEWLLEDRKLANAEMKANLSILESYWTPEKVERVDVSAALNKLNEVKAFNSAIDTQIEQVKYAKQSLEDLEKRKSKLIDELHELENSIVRKKEDLEIQEAWIKQYLPEWELRKQIGWADEQNKKANNYEQYLKAQTAYNEKKEKYDALDQQIEKLRNDKDIMIKSAKMPIENMIFTEKDWIVINWIPFSQHSTWQQLIMACKIASFMDPELKVIVIKDWSLLDDKSVEEISKFAEENEYQVYMEIVNEQAWTIIMREWHIEDMNI